MNKSISTSFANGGKINTYAEGTEKLENAYKDTKYTSYGKPLKSNRSISDMIELSKEDFDNLKTRTIDLTEIPDEKRDEVLRGLPATTYYELPYSLMKKYDPFFDGLEKENKHIYYTKYNDDPEDYRLTVVKSGTKEGNALLDRLVFNEQLKNYIQNDNNIVLPDIVVTPDKKEAPKRKKVLADEYSIEPYINPYEE